MHLFEELDIVKILFGEKIFHPPIAKCLAHLLPGAKSGEHNHLEGIYAAKVIHRAQQVHPLGVSLIIIFKANIEHQQVVERIAEATPRLRERGGRVHRVAAALQCLLEQIAPARLIVNNQDSTLAIHRLPLLISWGYRSAMLSSA